eukprot:m.16398 g.16398  ORF g.16398 m.16398 type:complete len:309 (+) comp5044_c0_seq1:182-1108(+)
MADAAGVEASGLAVVYDYMKSTAENHQATGSDADRPFTGRYGECRSGMDHSYHGRYTVERERLQDSLLDRVLNTSASSLHGGPSAQDVKPTNCTKRRPFIVFMAGGMGSGKTHMLRWANKKGYFDTMRYVYVDPDRFKCRLPETEEYIRRDPTTAGSMTHAESAYLAEIAQEAALQQCKNVLVDGSLRDWRWYTDVFAAIQRDRPHYRIAIIKVTCRRETMHQRAATRGEKTGRVVSKELLDESRDAADASVEKLTRFCEYVFEIDSEGRDPVVTGIIAQDSRLEVTDGWAQFQSAWRRQEGEVLNKL